MIQHHVEVVLDDVGGATIMMDNVEVGDATIPAGDAIITIIVIITMTEAVVEVVDGVVDVDTTMLEAVPVIIIILVVGVVEEDINRRQDEPNHKDSIVEYFA